MLPESLPASGAILDQPNARRIAPWHFDHGAAHRALCAQFGTQDLAGFGCEEAFGPVAAAGALLHYALETQRTDLPHLRGIRLERREQWVGLDAVSRRNLEINASMSGEPGHSLAAVLDGTATAMGSRELNRWLANPLRDRIPCADGTRR